MPEGESSSSQDEIEDELEITDLRARRGVRAWQGLALGLSLVLLVAVLLVTPVSRGSALWGLAGALASPTTTSTGVPLLPTETLSAALPPTPAPPVAAPTAVPDVSGVPALGPPPVSCSEAPPTLTNEGPPFERASIGHAPVLLGGFVGPYATLPLGPAANAAAYGWTAPYTRYGWPAPIGLVLLGLHVSGPVTLSGWDLRTGHPLWFGFIVAGEWGLRSRWFPPLGSIQPIPPSPRAARRGQRCSGTATPSCQGRAATPSPPPGRVVAGRSPLVRAR
jgi:hypothetical protein